MWFSFLVTTVIFHYNYTISIKVYFVVYNVRLIYYEILKIFINQIRTLRYDHTTLIAKTKDLAVFIQVSKTFYKVWSTIFSFKIVIINLLHSNTNGIHLRSVGRTIPILQTHPRPCDHRLAESWEHVFCSALVTIHEIECSRFNAKLLVHVNQ